MKKLKKPTRDQKKAIQRLNLNPIEWFVERDTPEILVIVNRSDNTIFTLHKEKER